MQVRTRTGARILAILRKNGTMVNSPDGDTRLEAGDRLAVIGTKTQLRELDGLK